MPSADEIRDAQRVTWAELSGGWDKWDLELFRCAGPGCVSAMYEVAGLRDVAEWDVDVELVTASPAEYWEMMSEHVSLAVAALQQVDEPSRERIRATVIADVSAYEKDGKFGVPGVARCIVGTK